MVESKTVKAEDGSFASFYYQVVPMAGGLLGTTAPQWHDPRKLMDPPRPISDALALTEEVVLLMQVFTAAQSPFAPGALDNMVTRVETALQAC